MAPAPIHNRRSAVARRFLLWHLVDGGEAESQARTLTDSPHRGDASEATGRNDGSRSIAWIVGGSHGAHGKGGRR